MQQTTHTEIDLNKKDNEWLEEFLNTNDVTELMNSPEQSPNQGGKGSGIVQIENFNQIKKKAIRLYEGNRFKEATQAIEDAIRLLPGDLELNFFHAQCLCRLGNFDQATKILENLINIDEDKSFTHLPRLLVYLLLVREKYIEAEKWVHNLLAQYGNDMQLRSMLGFVKEKQDKLDEAQTIFTKILEEDADNANACNSLAYIYYRKKINMQLAVELTTRALNSEARNPAFLDTYGVVQHWAKNTTIAKEALQEALKIAPKNGIILAHIGEFLET
ncbi:MAG: tetratricopeptide repeat protein [Leptospirales bacterium]